MNVLNRVGYDPRVPVQLDDAGLRLAVPRPPRDPAAVCDYLAWLGYTEDGGAFMHSEMAQILDHPDDFFGQPYAPGPSAA